MDAKATFNKGLADLGQEYIDQYTRLVEQQQAGVNVDDEIRQFYEDQKVAELRDRVFGESWLNTELFVASRAPA